MAPIRLAPQESPVDHPCADPLLYQSDQALLAYLLQDLRSLMRRCCKGELTIEPYEVLQWDVHGLQRRVVMCDPASLMRPDTFQIVGFFGDRRPDADVVSLDSVEIDLLGEFRSYPGILSYSSVELVEHHWANLVVHTRSEDRDAWRGSAVHRHAVDSVAPRVYGSVRIHNGRLDGGVIGTDHIVIEVTKYWDYAVDPVWHAIRPIISVEPVDPNAPFSNITGSGRP